MQGGYPGGSVPDELARVYPRVRAVEQVGGPGAELAGADDRVTRHLLGRCLGQHGADVADLATEILIGAPVGFTAGDDPLQRVRADWLPVRRRERGENSPLGGGEREIVLVLADAEWTENSDRNQCHNVLWLVP